MKICLINNLYPPFNRGGAERVLENQIKELLAQGHDVFVITSRPLRLSSPKIGPASPNRGEEVPSAKAGEGYREEPKQIYRFYPLNLISYYHLSKLPAILRAIWRVFDTFNLHSYFKIKKILRAEKPDIVYIHNLTGIGLLMPRLIEKLKIKYIQTMHDVVAVRPSGLLMLDQEPENILIKIWARFNRWLYSSPDEVHFPSKWLMDYYSTHNFFPNSKKEVARNFPVPTVDLLFNKKLKSPDQITFLYVGQIESHKGILFLIKTLNELRIKNYELWVAGAGSTLSQAKELAKNNPRIKFLGYQPPEKIQEYFQQADYTIVPSLCYENSPTVIFESLAAGVPVIATNIGGIPELVRVGENGYLFKPSDKKELLDILEKLTKST
ncbi:MAG TPA: glycosyltransferase family 4 protein [Patescibacteria group bacterium]|nr:glycosyltransferase family 4 protein [Patescibacteria group bacterium]